MLIKTRELSRVDNNKNIITRQNGNEPIFFLFENPK